MEKRSARPAREIVVPGDILDDSGAKAGDNTYTVDGKVYAAVLGVKNKNQYGVGVIPGRQDAEAGDMVIGMINDIDHPTGWWI